MSTDTEEHLITALPFTFLAWIVAGAANQINQAVVRRYENAVEAAEEAGVLHELTLTPPATLTPFKSVWIITSCLLAFVVISLLYIQVRSYIEGKLFLRKWDAEKKEKQLSELLSQPLLSSIEQEAEELKRKYLSEQASQ